MKQSIPQFTIEELVYLARQYYGLIVTVEPLPSDRDQNALLTAKTGERWVLKIANASESIQKLDLQNQVLDLLHPKMSFCPRLIPALDGACMLASKSAKGSAVHQVRLLSYLPGRPLAQRKRPGLDLFADLGRKLGQMDRAFAGFEHQAAHKDFDWDLAHASKVYKKYRQLIKDPDLASQIDECTQRFQTYCVPHLDQLPKSVIHNDANDYNVLVQAETDGQSAAWRVSGIIDFGDLVYSYTVCNLAIALAYAMLDKSDPLQVGITLARAYHEIQPLSEIELTVLFPLACMRLCVSSCMAAYQSQMRPDDNYLEISQTPIRRTLPVLLDIHPRFAEVAFRRKLGFVGSTHSVRVVEWLKQHPDDIASVIDFDPERDHVAVLDLGVSGALIHADAEQNKEPLLTQLIFAHLTALNAKVGIGRYQEARLLYTSPLFSDPDPLSGSNRTIHIGLDLFAPVDTAVFAPMAGVVEAVETKYAALDYGGMLLLRHEVDPHTTFYTLYGHLNPASLSALAAGQSVKKSQQIGTLGSARNNGGWTPHLHFQLISDLLDRGSDFPGVVSASACDRWCVFSPDPNLVIKIPNKLVGPATQSVSASLTKRRRILGPNLSLGYDQPIKAVRGWRQYLFDHTGRRYLDAYNNVPHVGHCHPRVVEAATKQMSLLNTNTRYLNAGVIEYAEKLCDTMADPLAVCYLLNSASEANELALRLARAHTQAKQLIVLDAAYHGHTTTLIDISPYKHNGPGGQGAPDWVHTAPVADLYRGPYRANDPQAASLYVQEVERIVDKITQQGSRLCGFIAESCPSVAGQLMFPEGYLQGVYQAIRQAGGVCIADEVQTGFGRIGSHFYAYEAQGVVPDIVVLGKPIGNGHPLAAVVTTREIAESFNTGMEFFSTFGGNTVSCAVGLRVLAIVREEQLQQHAYRVGQQLLAQLGELSARHAIVGDVRGSGLFIGVELVRDRTSLEPAAAEASLVINRMREAGILIGTDGPYHNVLKIRPPMPFDSSNAARLVECLDRVFSDEFEL